MGERHMNDEQFNWLRRELRFIAVGVFISTMALVGILTLLWSR